MEQSTALNALIIEPDTVYRAILSNVLQEYGFRVTFLTWHADSIEDLDVNHYRLVCIADQLEGVSGEECCRSLRARYHNQNIPVVIMTGENGDYREFLQKKSGITEVFNKTDLTRFKRFISDVVRRYQQVVSLCRKHILLVEDNSAMIDLIKIYLRELEVNITVVAHAEAALQQVVQHEYDLMLVDMMLEGKMSGLELLRMVRSLPEQRKSRIPFLGISGIEDVAIRLEFLNSGANDFLSKPFLFEELVSRLKNLLMIKHLFDKIDEQHRDLQSMAVTDQLTGLPNRHCLNMMAPKFFSDSQRHNFPLSLLVIDIDHFKKINDINGHLVGDMVLVGVGQYIKKFFREEDFPARFGGEEFIVLLPHCDLENASKKAEELRLELAQLRPSGVNVTASIGVASLRGHRNFNELFRDADEAVYSAKDQGRNCVVAC